MDHATLVGASVEGGKRLIQKLDREGFNVDAALWLHDAEDGGWKLIIASKDVKNRDPRNAYKTVRRVIRSDPTISVDFDDVMITSRDDELIKLLRRAIHTGPGISTQRFSKSSVGNVFIDDAIIYRLQ